MNKKIAQVTTVSVVVAIIITVGVFSYFHSFGYNLTKAEEILRNSGKTDSEITKFSTALESKKSQLASIGYTPVKLAEAITGTGGEGEEGTPEVEEPETKVDVPEESNPIATINIKDKGSMKFELFPMQAPQSVYNFVSLANSKFYDGLSFHRVECSADGTPLVAQGGDPEGNGQGGPGYNIMGEFSSNGIKNDLEHKKGALAWARSTEADTAGSQFFINLADNPTWNGEYAVFGKLIEGEEVLDSISKECSTATEEQKTAPKTPITIESVTVHTKGIEYPQPDKI